MTTFIGDTFDSTERIQTHCHSLDWALADSLGNTGYPLRSVSEVYGSKGIGKTSWCVSMMGIIASKLGRNISLLDWEGQSKETIEGILNFQKFYGQVNYLLNKGSETPEDTLERFVDSVAYPDWNVGLVDSLGAFTPSAMIKGKIGDANMGVQARETGQFVSKVIHVTREVDEPGAVFMTNHLHPKIGSMISGQDTGGGEKKKYLAHVRIDLKRAYIGNSPVEFSDGYLLKGKVDNNRFGYSKRIFHVFLLNGEGIHVGLSALWDCVIAKYAKLSAASIKDSVNVEMDGVDYGKFRNIVKEKNNPEFFTPFINMIRQEPEEETEEEYVELEYPEDTPNNHKKGNKK